MMFTGIAWGQATIEQVKAMAEDGDAEAQYSLGIRYLNGIGLEKNEADAVKWFRKAADQEHLGAQYNLGLCYYNGYGVEKNLAEALKWSSKAAKQSAEAEPEKTDYTYYDMIKIGLPSKPPEPKPEEQRDYMKPAPNGTLQQRLLSGMFNDDGTPSTEYNKWKASSPVAEKYGLTSPHLDYGLDTILHPMQAGFREAQRGLARMFGNEEKVRQIDLWFSQNQNVCLSDKEGCTGRLIYNLTKLAAKYFPITLVLIILLGKSLLAGIRKIITKIKALKKAEQLKAESTTDNTPQPLNSLNAAPRSPSNHADRLRSLDKLYKEGIISDDEYKQKKNALLEQL